MADSSPSLSHSPKLPQPIFKTIFAFSPNRDTLGGTAYLIVEETGNILIDCPAWIESHHDFLRRQGGVRWLFLTHRDGIGKVQEIQTAFHCEVILQEQEAYLLPEVQVTSFRQEYALNPHTFALWTPGYSPGSSCLYTSHYDGILLCGRHLLPNSQGNVLPLKMTKTFHWHRQLQSVQKLCDRFTAENLHYLCPGGNIGFLRGQGKVDQAYQRLKQLTKIDVADFKHE